ncbi:hypothetical protein [Paenibacillus koleovorans]|uniref:hypothetical protein n=1 Tax=Paenibacillus koleovorans TaxID=121608 RepID=UPI000FDA3E1D|nr:hypothetical protein [Paenibacillus koleovorans]
MKKIYLIVLTFVVMLCSAIPAIAKQTSPDLTENTFKTKNDYFREIKKDGLSDIDAEHFADLELSIQKWKRENKVFDLDNVEPLSDEFVRANPDLFRKKVVDGDPAAIKKLLLTKANLYGVKDVQEYIEKNGPSKVIKIEYPDGSSVTASMDTYQQENTSNLDLTTNTYVGGPWNKDYRYGSNYDPLFSPGGWGSWFEYQINGPGGFYIKLKETLNFDVLTPCTPSAPLSCRSVTTSSYGAASSWGVATVDNENNVISQNDTNNGGYLQGYHDVRFKASIAWTIGAFINESISLNEVWHQYSVIEVTGAGAITFWQAYYK